jgi:hypothetical protein
MEIYNNYVKLYKYEDNTEFNKGIKQLDEKKKLFCYYELFFNREYRRLNIA